MENHLHEKFMRMAIDLSAANISRGDGGPFGAVIVKDGSVISASANRVVVDTDPTAHAEVSAIRQACKALGSADLAGCVIYTSCEPCPMCLGAIYWARIDQVFYANTRVDAASAGFDDDLIYSELACEMGDRKLPFVQLLRDDANHVFKLWDKHSKS